MPRLSKFRRGTTALAATGMLTAALGAGAVATAGPAAAAPVIKITWTTPTSVQESNSSNFNCPANNVMVGREHYGDENGTTTYHCARIVIDGELVTVTPGNWSSGLRESNSNFAAPENEAIVGRSHVGDENAFTSYRTGYLTWRNKEVSLTSARWTGALGESSHTSKAGTGEVMTGRQHYGDENGSTYYRYATVTFAG